MSIIPSTASGRGPASRRRIPLNGRSVTGFFYSQKMGRSVGFESTIERDLFYVLELDSNVISFEEQPYSFKYRYCGQERTYTPDVLITYRNPLHRFARSPNGGTIQLVEVKQLDDLLQNFHEYHPALRCGSRYANARGWGWRILTDRHIRTAFCRNARFLIPFRNRPTHRELRGLVFRTLATVERAKIGELLDSASFFDCRLEAQSVIWTLLAEGTVACDLDTAISLVTEIWLP